MTVSELTPLLQVFDMRASVAFYRDTLGFEVSGTYEPDGHLYWAELKLGAATLMLNASFEDDERPAEPDAARAEGHHDTELYLRCEDVGAIHADLQKRGVAVTPPQESHGRREIRISDPDGFVLSFFRLYPDLSTR